MHPLKRAASQPTWKRNHPCAAPGPPRDARGAPHPQGPRHASAMTFATAALPSPSCNNARAHALMRFEFVWTGLRRKRRRDKADGPIVRCADHRGASRTGKGKGARVPFFPAFRSSCGAAPVCCTFLHTVGRTRHRRFDHGGRIRASVDSCDCIAVRWSEEQIQHCRSC